MGNVPELRFPEFSGEWGTYVISDFGTVVTGSTPKTSVLEYYEDGSRPFVSPADINDSKCILKTKTMVTELGFQQGRIIPPKSVLFVSIGSTIGKVAMNATECITNQQINSIITDKYSSDFLYYSLYKISKKIKLIAGIQAVPILNKTEFSKIKITAPSLPEQQKIADFLTAIDEKIIILTDKITQLKTYKKGMMQKLLSAELRFPEFTDEWREVKLGEILTIGSGKDYKHLLTGNIPVYGTGGYMLSVNDYLYDGESVCIGRKGTIDKPIFLTGKFWTVDTLFYTYAFKDSIPRFVYYTFLSINWQKYNEASGVPSLSKKTIEKIKILLPALHEQQKIADFLTAIDDKLTIEQEKLDQLKLYKQGLLQKMFV